MKKYHAACNVVMFGLSFSIGKVSGSIGKVELEIPALFEGPEYLSGAISWLSGTTAAIKGKSWTSVTFGKAIGKFVFEGGEVHGWDVGVDAMYGWSYCR